MLKRVLHIFIFASVLVGLFANQPFTPAYAATQTVTNTNNAGAGSLRQAILNAGNGDTIDASGISGTIVLVSTLTIDKNLVIIGPGMNTLTISGNNAVRVFLVNAGKTVSISNLTIANGLNHYGIDNLVGGGGIHNLGNLSLSNVRVSNNSAVSNLGDLSAGGGIYSGINSSLSIINGVVSGNTAEKNGGGIFVDKNSEIQLENVVINNNQLTSSYGEGGGVKILAGGAATMINSAITNNLSRFEGGGVYSGSPMTITNSLIANNTVKSNNNESSWGGGLALYSGVFTLTNVTISGNSAEGGGVKDGVGGGISFGDGELNLHNVTIANNTADYGAGLYAATDYILSLENTIIGGNTGTEDGNQISCNYYYPLNSLGHNLLPAGDEYCEISGITTGNVIGLAPKLGPLANNGGPTQTMALLSDSPAINAGNDATCAATDQRGVVRPQGNHCDIGAFEAPTFTFADVPYYGFGWAQIESIYTAGITGGCSTNPLKYCPNQSVTRAQMAVFLLRGIHGSAYTPPPATGTVFADVPLGSFAAAWIEQMVDEGITAGCGGGNYCPNGLVTRAQMAVFLLRAKHGSSHTPPSATGTVFADVPLGSFAAAWIEQLVDEGITSGCGGGNYCPNQAVTRAQMAVFLQRTFNLPMP